MKLGMMNCPGTDLIPEIHFAGRQGFDFLDLTIEPPGALSIHPVQVRDLLRKYGLGVVGHSAYYLPIQSPFPSVRKVVLQEFKTSLHLLSRVGAPNMAVHILSRRPRFFTFDDWVDFHLSVLVDLDTAARDLGMILMLEHGPVTLDQFDLLDRLFAEIPDLRFHLDVGHANLETSIHGTAEFLRRYHRRLAHVHFSDNYGGAADLHLPILCGTLPWEEVIPLLQGYGYDGTITLEVFAQARDYLLLSKRIVEKLWREPRPWGDRKEKRLYVTS